MQRESSKNTGQTSGDGTISGRSRQSHLTSGKSISFVEDFHVKIFPTPGKGQDLMESEAVCSMRPRVSFAHWSQDTCCWKTWQRCLLGGWISFSGRWPRSGTMRNGIAYRLPPLAPRISGTGSGYWRTPGASETTGGAANGERRLQQGHAMSLSDQVNTPRMWPTPTEHGNYNRKGASPTSVDGLATVVAKYPTPSARDWKGDRSLGQTQKKNSRPLNEVIKNQEASGSLNPQFVSWLMGFPLDWCDMPEESQPEYPTESPSSGA